MLREALTYLTTPCDPRLRTMGYLRELIATAARFRRCESAWRPHLERTRAVIHDAIDRATQHRRAVVLGAGILSDIPIAALAQTFDAVDLIDACVLRQSRRATATFPNVRWRTEDITGLALPLCTGRMPTPAPVPGLIPDDSDLVVSANVLSQLPLLPVAHLHKVHPELDEHALYAFGGEIVRSHLAQLDACTSTVCLVSDVERQIIDGDTVIETEDPLWGVSSEMDGPEWLWNVAPKGEIDRTFGVRNRVVATIR